MTLLEGKSLGNYSVLEYIGAGGYAHVYRGIDKVSEKEYAIKVLKQSEDAKRRKLFQNEVELHMQLDHPSIVKVYDADTRDWFFLVMDYIPLGLLGEKQVQFSLLISYVKQIADALDYLHSKDIVHCDVNPHNILQDKNDTVLLCDFGSALNITQPITDVYGTCRYMSLEHWQRQPCPASDQYSLAVTVHEWLLDGRKYPVDKQEDVLKQPPPSLRKELPTLSQEVEKVIFKALERRSEDRYPTVSAFASALEKAVEETQQDPIVIHLPFLSPSSSGRTQRARDASAPADFLSRGSTIRVPRDGEEHNSLYVYWGHDEENVTALAWSPDGKRLVSADTRNAIHIWDAFNPNNVVIYKGMSHMILNILWAPDGDYIAVADELQVVHLWDIHNNKRKLCYEHLVGRPDEIGIGLRYPMAWSKDGQFIISASDDQPLERWDTTTGKRFPTYEGHPRKVKVLAWSPDERSVVSSSIDATVHVWDAMSGGKQLVYNRHFKSRDIRALSWSSDSQRVASADDNGLVHIWSASDGELLFIYDKHFRYSINSIAWSPDGTKIASAGVDKCIRVWDAHSGETLVVYNEHIASVNLISWSPDGKHLASASRDGTVRVWHVKDVRKPRKRR